MTDQFFFPLLVSLLVASLAGTFSLLGLIITKENKVSEFRQAWIDALRTSIADYCSQSFEMLRSIESSKAALVEAAAEPNEGGPSTLTRAEMLKLIEPTYSKAASAEASIRLRINADDPDENLRRLNKELLDAMQRIDKRTEESMTAVGVSVHADIEDLIKVSSKVLKLEWERVKAGEKNFQKAKRYCKGMLGGIAAAFALLFLVWICTRSQPKTDVPMTHAAALSAPALASTRATSSSPVSTLVTRPQTAPPVPKQPWTSASGAKP